MIDQSLAHYRITASIGAGGMGEVYRATDTKLGRDVALKVLPAEMAADPERLERFQREARALAALDHPGIVSVFSVEESDGVHFLTMQLVEGQSLDLVIPEGGLDADRLLEIAVPLSDALAAAHEKGIVHRDLKPANVMIAERGRVKVLDFGLAKLAAAETGDNLGSQLPTEMHTRDGVVMGTMPYMSPEQVAGRVVDHRTDIFSLGVILYEMASGTRPFRGNSSAELISSILRDTPSAILELRADLPRHLSRIIGRCLEKDTRDRMQSAQDLHNELKGLRAELAFAPASGVSLSTPGRGSPAPSSGSHPSRPVAPWIAVLPLKGPAGDAELDAFADGLSEDITTGLSRFPFLFVVSRNSTLQFKNQSTDVRSIGSRLGASYALEGAVRKAGGTVRVSIQLLDTSTGTTLWAEAYDRDFAKLGIFAVQDEITDRVVATVADPYGVLVRSMALAVRDRPIEELTATEMVLRFYAYWHQIRADEHARLRAALERGLEREPAHADAWACLSRLYSHEHQHRLNPLPDSIERARNAARRSVEIDPTCQLGWEALADAAYFARDLGTFRTSAERAMSLNPRNTSTVATMAMLIAFSGEWERGVEITRKAMVLNPHHPGWYHFAPFYNHFRKGEYEEALETAKRINMPEFFWSHFVTAAVCGRLGRREDARAALDALERLFPAYREDLPANEELWILDADLVERLMQGLAEAEALAASSPAAASLAERARTPPVGRDAEHAGVRPAASLDSGATRAEDGFWVAVLPFKSSGADANLTALAEGLTEDIVTGLSRFSYLRVIARSSTSRHTGEAADVRSLGKDLGARYVMEGSIRQAGSTLRIAAQLVDAGSGAHLWAETYTRPLHPDQIFELQDEVAPRIVSTVADMNGVLPHTMSEALRGRRPEELTPYEAVLRSFGYMERLNAEEHAAVRDGLERAVEAAPGNADALAMLSTLYADEHKHGFNVRPDPLGRALDAARRAVAAAPSNHLGYHMLAQALFFRREFQAFRNAAERAVALNPMDGCTTAFMGILMGYAGDWEHGCALAAHAMQLNPHHPGWYRFASFNNAFRKGDDRGALDVALKINMPSYFYTHEALAAAYGQLGEKEAGRNALRELLAQKPDFGLVVREELGKWVADPALLERHVDGLRKAGLEIPEVSAAPADSTPIAIAVLPFADMSAARDQEYLCEGMAEEIMNALVRVAGIRVASRTSAFRARRDGAELPAIARALSVGHVLEGSVRTSGSRLRVTAQLTDAATGYQIWSERFDREASDVFAVQDEIAAGVVEGVRARLAPGARAIRARPPVANLEAYRHYLKGRHLRYTKNDQADALKAFQEAVRLDPSHAASWEGLAEVHILAAMYSLVPAQEAFAAAKKALARAAAQQGESADSLFVESMIAFAERDWEAAERALRRAVDLRPDHVQARCWSALLLTLLGRTSEAMPHLQHARESDPLAPYPYAMSGVALLLDGRAAEAEALFAQALAFDRENTLALWGSGLARTALGRFEDGLAMLERAATPSHRGGFIHGALGWALAAAGRIDESRAILKELQARPVTAPAVVPEGWLLAALGEKDAAFQVLQRAEAERQGMLLLVGFPGFDPLRSDPRFEALLASLGLSFWAGRWRGGAAGEVSR